MEQIILNLNFLFWTWEIIAVAHITFENQRKHEILRFYLGRFEQQVIINFT